MDQLADFQQKSFKTTRGYVYNYYLYNPTSAKKPALILSHGWPDNTFLWADIVPALLSSGHPLLIPDMLGYGGTSKPTATQEYNTKSLAHDLYELLDSEGFDKVIAAGHDWGSLVSQRLYMFQPERVIGLVLLSVAYVPFYGADRSKGFDLEATNELSTRTFGYPRFAYWDLLAADDGPELLQKHVEILFHIIHGSRREVAWRFFCEVGGARRLLQTATPSDLPLQAYAQRPGFKDAFVTRFRKDGFVGPQNRYMAIARNVDSKVEREIPSSNLKIRVPILYISSTGDPVCRTDGMERVKELVEDVTTRVVDSSHWIPYEMPKEVRDFMRAWLDERFANAFRL